MIRDRPYHQLLGESDIKTLEPGTYFGSNGETAHQVSCEAEEECIVYVHMESRLNSMPIFWTFSRVLLVVLAAALGGCGGESGPPADELTGSWQATRIEYVGVESGRSVELAERSRAAARSTARAVETPMLGAGPARPSDLFAQSFTRTKDAHACVACRNADRPGVFLD